MRSTGLLFVLLLAVAGAAAQEPRADQSEGASAVAVVPVVGNVFGYGMVRWKANVDLVNDTGAAVDVALELPGAPGSPVIFLSLAPGQVQRFGDITGEAFGLEGVISPLRVITGARRSISVNTNIYALTGEGISPLQPIPVYYGATWFPLRVLDDLAFTDEQRTNIGLVNLSDAPTEFLLALQRIPGRSIAVTHIRVPAQSIRHDSIQALFPLITKGTGFSVVVESPSVDTMVYGSVIENSSSEARFIAPRPGTR